MTSTSLEATLKSLEKLYPKYIDLSLNRLNNLLEKLDNPHLKLPPVKLHCSMLMEDAIKAAISDYKKKQ